MHLVDVPQHIIQRGNNRQATFFAEEDYCFYLERLGEGARKYACSVYAYVLMTNHVHLLASAQRPYALSLMMHRELFRTEFDSKELTEIRSAANCGWPLGSDRFKDEIERALICAVRPPKPGRPPKNRTTTPRAEQRRAYYRTEKLH